MTILPLSSTPGRNTPNQQTSSYFPSQDTGPTIGIPGQNGGAFGRRKSDGGHGFGFGGSNSNSGRGHRGGINGGGVSNFVPLFLRRLFRFPHMDFQVQSQGLKLYRRNEDRKRRTLLRNGQCEQWQQKPDEGVCYLPPSSSSPPLPPCKLRYLQE